MIRSLIDNRFLIRELVIRDVRSRYVGTFLGIFWSVLNPLLQLALYTVVFSVIIGIRFDRGTSTGNFAEYLFCALLPWTAIQESVTRAAGCFFEHANIIKKMRVELETIPFSLVLSAGVHQLLGTGVFVLVLAGTGSLEPRTILLILPLLFFQSIFMLGLSLVTACLNVFFRDLAQILGVGFLMAFWITPVVYPKSLAPESFRWILDLNPLTHMVEAYRYAFLGEPIPSLPGVAYWIVFCFLLYMAGTAVLKRTRKELVDLI